jgi:hypothetical protein
MCKKREQERKPSTQQCMEYCGTRQGGQEWACPTGKGGRTPEGSCPVPPRAQGLSGG